MVILLRDVLGRFFVGNTGYWKGTRGVKKANSGSFRKGLKPWNSGTAKIFICAQCGNSFNSKTYKNYQKFCSKACYFMYCEKNSTYKEVRALRKSAAYKRWRRSVLVRDGYRCTKCGKEQKMGINVDHIKPRVLFPELSLEVSNGRTLCFECHKETVTYGKKRGQYVG